MQQPSFIREKLKPRSFDELTWFEDISSQDPASEILEPRRAIWLAHRVTILETAAKLRLGFSTLVICDKALAPDLAALIHNELKREAFEFVRVEGRSSPLSLQNIDQVTDVAEEVNIHTLPGLKTYMNDFIRLLTSEPDNHIQTRVVIVDHIDLITTDTNGQPLGQAGDIIYLMTAHRKIKVLAFADPTSPLPKIVEDLFTAKLEIPALDRRDLWRLLRPNEARCFSPDPLTVSTQLKLFQYLSGVNAIRFRQWLREICNNCIAVGSEKDAQPIYDKIRRELTPVGELYLPDVSEDQIAGYEDLKDQLKRTLLAPMRWRLEASTQEKVEEYDHLIPKGILLFGPPGTGKTEISKWLATALDAVLIIVRGPELKSMWHGQTERAVRRIFAQARRSAPSTILIDEIDSIMPSRDPTTSNVEASMVAQLLTEMDGLGTDKPVIVIGTTNRLDAIDSAFLRPGRFELKVHVDYPDKEAREKILRHYFEYFDLATSQDWSDNNSPAALAVAYLVEHTEGPIDSNREEKQIQFRDFMLEREFGQGFRDIIEVAGSAFLQAVNDEFEIGNSSHWAGDHLRSMCQTLARERHWHEEQQIPFNLYSEEILTATILAQRTDQVIDSNSPDRSPLSSYQSSQRSWLR